MDRTGTPIDAGFVEELYCANTGLTDMAKANTKNTDMITIDLLLIGMLLSPIVHRCAAHIPEISTGPEGIRSSSGDDNLD
jgi:hypothetical protein